MCGDMANGNMLPTLVREAPMAPAMIASGFFRNWKLHRNVLVPRKTTCQLKVASAAYVGTFIII